MLSEQSLKLIIPIENDTSSHKPTSKCIDLMAMMTMTFLLESLVFANMVRACPDGAIFVQ